jgi:hypothetical protein
MANCGLAQANSSMHQIGSSEDYPMMKISMENFSLVANNSMHACPLLEEWMHPIIGDD